MNEIKVNVKLSPEYLKRLDELRANMKAYGRKQVWEECTCKNCKWWEKRNNEGTRITKVWGDCRLEKNVTTVNLPHWNFGCNCWEKKEE